MTEYTIHIPHWHPVRLNQLLNCHWGWAHSLKTANTQMIGVYAHQAKVPKATGRRSVKMLITMGKGQRTGDPDAYYKTTHDSLVNLGLLKNDNHVWLELTPVEFKRGEMATTITLRDSNTNV